MSETRLEVVDLTRLLAARLSELVPDYQRNRRKAWVMALSRDMDEGRWEISPDCITVATDADGEWLALLNGQHRVFARLRAKTEHPIPVALMEREVTGEERQAYLVFDAGAKRTFNDWLKTEGVPNFNQAAAIARRCQIIDQDPGGAFVRTPESATLSNSALAGWWRAADQELMADCVRLAGRVRSAVGITTSAAGAVAYIGSRDFSRDQTFAFFNDVIDGADDAGPGEPKRASVLLRNSLLTSRARAPHRKVNEVVVWNTMLKSFHSFVAGERRMMLRYAVGANEKDLPVVTEWMRQSQGRLALAAQAS